MVCDLSYDLGIFICLSFAIHCHIGYFSRNLPWHNLNLIHSSIRNDGKKKKKKWHNPWSLCKRIANVLPIMCWANSLELPTPRNMKWSQELDQPFLSIDNLAGIRQLTMHNGQGLAHYIVQYVLFTSHQVTNPFNNFMLHVEVCTLDRDYCTGTWMLKILPYTKQENMIHFNMVLCSGSWKSAGYVIWQDR